MLGSCRGEKSRHWSRSGNAGHIGPPWLEPSRERNRDSFVVIDLLVAERSFHSEILEAVSDAMTIIPLRRVGWRHSSRYRQRKQRAFVRLGKVDEQEQIKQMRRI